MSTARAIWLVARREFKARMLTKANIISLAIILTLIAAGAAVASYFINKEDTTPTAHLAFDDSVGELEPFLEDAALRSGYLLDIQDLGEDEAQAILAGEADSPTPLDAYITGDPTSPDVTVANPDNHGVKGIIVGAVQSYTLTETVLDMGGDPNALEDALSRAYPAFDSPTPSESWPPSCSSCSSSSTAAP
jgi:ABC-2 type transport system permease protein